MSMPPVRLEPTLHDKVWGTTAAEGRRLGEMWFAAEPLLVKFIFTSDKLSVQVHPDDEYAARHEGGRGKTEMWYVVDAQPGARLAVGLRRPLTPPQLRAAALDGSVERELRWFEVRCGDTVFVPAGSVHAIGPGLTLCEIQQLCDLTYRLYDYGRPRELHLEKALAAIRAVPGAGPVELPFACDYFRVQLLRQAGAVPPGLLVVLKGAGTLSGETYRERQVWNLSEPAELLPQQSTTCLLVNS